MLKYHLGRADYADDLREAVRLVPADPPSPARARVARGAGPLHPARTRRRLDDPELRAIAEEAVVTARRAGDAATEAAALVTLACAEPIGGNVERIRALLAQARVVASRVKACQPLLDAAITESETLEGAGLHELAAAVAREGLAAAREYGLARTYGAVLAGNLAEPLVSLGRWDEAGEVIEARAAALPAHGLNRTYLWRLTGDIALARGDLAAAAESVASIRAVLDQHPVPRPVSPAAGPAGTRVAAGPGTAGRGPALRFSDALDRFDLRHSPRYAWPLLVAGARACAAAAAARDGISTGRQRRCLIGCGPRRASWPPTGRHSKPTS